MTRPEEIAAALERLRVLRISASTIFRPSALIGVINEMERLLRFESQPEPTTPAAQAGNGAGEMREEITSLIGEGVHACLRKCCDSPAADRAYHAIQEMDDDEWAGVCETVADALLSHLVRALPAPEVADRSFSDRLLNSNLDSLECERLGGDV